MASLTGTTSFSTTMLLFQNNKEMNLQKHWNYIDIRSSRKSFGICCRKQDRTRKSVGSSFPAFALSPELEQVAASSSSSSLDGITVAATTTSEERELKIRVDVTGAKTEEIFDNVFSKMVAAAQPIPGFRRVKGGKTPNIPRDVLIQVLGPAKVYKQVIRRVINSSIAEYVDKEGLKVTKDLRVEQSYEELEANFEPGEEFSFDAFIHLQETNSTKS